MRIKKEKNFISIFNEQTGEYVRSGIIKNGTDTGEDPFMASFPELLDVGIMGHCLHGQTGLCQKAKIGCYQDGLHSTKNNMSLADFQHIVEQCQNRTFQFALGGCGDPDQHENFPEILQMCKEAGIVPNFTTSGYGLTEQLASICKKYCGTVAVSWYRSTYTKRAIHMLLEAKVKTNIHYVLSKSTIREALQLLKETAMNTGNGFPSGINAVIFLLHKPVGLGKREEMITLNNKTFQKFITYIDTHTFPYKIGFDSCTVPALLNMTNVNPDSLDTCEGGRWSAYITPDMKLLPCSFDNQAQHWSVDLRTHSIEEAWNSETFDNFRSRFVKSCSSCEKRASCMGGCPMIPEIVLCERRER